MFASNFPTQVLNNTSGIAAHWETAVLVDGRVSITKLDGESTIWDQEAVTSVVSKLPDEHPHKVLVNTALQNPNTIVSMIYPPPQQT